MNVTTSVGILASVLTIFNMFPQYLKVVRSKHTKDLALGTFISLSLSACLWVIYGALRHDNVIIVANVPVFFFCFSILIMKVRYG